MWLARDSVKDWRERVERLLVRLDQRLTDEARIDQLEGLLEDFVTTMENKHATDQDWLDLLNEVKAAL